MAPSEKPTLWHIPVSHYSEKARWALAHKGVEHDRHAPPPGAHILIALWLTRGDHKTFPVLRLDGRNVGDRRRSSKRSSGARRRRRFTRTIPRSACGRWSSRTTSTRN